MKKKNMLIMYSAGWLDQEELLLLRATNTHTYTHTHTNTHTQHTHIHAHNTGCHFPVFRKRLISRDAEGV